MGILESNKRDGKSNKNVVITSRLTSKEYEKFKEVCDATGYSIAEAVRLLVVSELNPKQRPAPTYASPAVTRPVEPVSTRGVETEAIQKVYTPATRPVSTGGFAKFTTERWKVNEFLPCPICNEWHSATNFSRHAKKVHSLSTKDIFTAHKDEADAMVKEREVE